MSMTPSSLDPHHAWMLWNTLMDLAQDLWDCHEPSFVEFIIQEQNEQNQPPSHLDYPDGGTIPF